MSKMFSQMKTAALLVGMASLLGIMLAFVIYAPAETVYRIGVGIALYALLVNTLFWAMSMMSSTESVRLLRKITEEDEQ